MRRPSLGASSIAALAAALFPSVAPASVQGAVLVVDAAGGPGVQHTAIHTAVAAAAPGDTVLVRAGSYPGFAVGKPLLVIADAGAAVQVSGAVSVAGTAVGETVTLLGLEFRGYPASLQITGCRGPVWIEACRTRIGGAGFHALEISDSAAVTVARSRLEAAGTGGYGVGVLRSNAYFAQTSIRGGDGAFEVSAGCGLVVQGTPQVGGFAFLTDCSVSGGMDLYGGLTIAVGGWGYHHIELLDSALLGPRFSSTPPGTINQRTGAGRTLAASSPVRGGNILNLDFLAQPGDVVGVLIAASPLSSAPLLEAWNGVLLLAPPWSAFAAGVVPVSGQHRVRLPVPALAAGRDVVQLYVQGFGVGGSSVWIGSGSALAVLNARF